MEHKNARWANDFSFDKGHRIFSEDGIHIATVHKTPNGSEGKNSKLIASAPEMLEFLIALKEGSSTKWDFDKDKLDSLIKQATE
jgi:hypothetical protein